MAALLRDVPSELIEQIGLYIKYRSLRSMAKELGPFSTLLESDAYWARQELAADDHSDLLHCVLQDPNTRHASRLRLDHAFGVDDVDVAWVSSHCLRLTHVTINDCRTVTDKGVADIVAQHGKYIVVLDISSMPHLSDLALEAIALHCTALEALNLSKGSFTMNGLGLLLKSRVGTTIKRLSLSRCYSLDCTQLSIVINDERTPRMKLVDLSHLDFLQPHHMRAVAVACRQSLRRLIVKGCTEITLRAVRETVSAIQALARGRRNRLRIDHNAYLEDHTIDGVRRFLLGLVNL